MFGEGCITMGKGNAYNHIGQIYYIPLYSLNLKVKSLAMTL